MIPEQTIALAKVSGSPALHALVVGHLQAGRTDMAAAALWLPPETLAWLDAWLAERIDRAREAGAVAALMAMKGLGMTIRTGGVPIGFGPDLDRSRARDVLLQDAAVRKIPMTPEIVRELWTAALANGVSSGSDWDTLERYIREGEEDAARGLIWGVIEEDAAG